MYSKKWCNSVKLHTCKPPKPWKLANRMLWIRVFRFRFVDVMGSVVTQWSAFQLGVGKFLRCRDWEVAPHLVNEPLVEASLELLAGRFQCCGFFFFFSQPCPAGGSRHASLIKSLQTSSRKEQLFSSFHRRKVVKENFPWSWILVQVFVA